MKKHIKDKFELIVTKANDIDSHVSSVDNEEVVRAVNDAVADIVEVITAVKNDLKGTFHSGNDKYFVLTNGSNGPQLVNDDSSDEPKLFASKQEIAKYMREEEHFPPGADLYRIFPWKAY